MEKRQRSRLGGAKQMQVRFLYSEDCPSHDEALQRLRNALDEENVPADIEIVRVNTFEEAARERYPGSPTIMIDGHDICPTSSSHYAPACRAYVLEDGRISPLPSVLMIRKAIRAAKQNLKKTPEKD
jgi:hypothetical protein